MKKLLLAFSLIAIFGIGITTASNTFPNSDNNVEKKDSNKEINNPNLSNQNSEPSNNKSCCTKIKKT
jgi:hypothetical protein